MKYDASKIKKYYFSFRKSVKFFYIVLFSATIFTILVARLYAGGSTTIFWIFSATIFGFALLQSLIFRRISKPQIELSKVIFGISNQISVKNLPAPHEKDNSRSGFGEVLKFIYSIDIPTENRDGEPKENLSVPDILKLSKISFITLNSGNEIISKSKVNVDLSMIRKDKSLEISNWIEQARSSKIRDSKIWERVPSNTSPDEEQKLYDVAVFFEKQFKQDVAIFFIDKTENYDNDENDLNFIAFAAHEIRGPITIIRGYLDILSSELEGLLSPTQKELFLRLVVSSNKLTGYINNILNVAKFDQNRLEFSPKKHSVGRIFEEINEDISIRASAQNRELQINIPHNLPEVSADIYGASEILINLIDNAIKYSNEGGLIEVGAQENGDFVEVSVKDYGIGIPNGVLKNLFSKFYRSHRSRETVAGSGIGLYISKAIAENMGGKISVSSKEGKGSTFTVYFPIFDKINSNSALPDTKNIIIKNHGKML